MLFAVIAVDNPGALGDAIAKIYAGEHFVLTQDQWLVVDTGTTKDVSDKLGITDGANGGALVISISGYFGRKGANVWEWMKAKTV